MGNYKRYIFLGLVVIFVTLGIFVLFISSRSRVLGEKIVVTPSPTPSESPSPTPTESPTPEPTETPTLRPTPTRSPLPTPSPLPPSEINALIERFSSQYSVDPNVMRHIAICESGFNPNARNGPFWGLYQFAKITWKNLREEFGEDPSTELRLSAEEAAQTAAYALSKGKQGIWPNCAP